MEWAPEPSWMLPPSRLEVLAVPAGIHPDRVRDHLRAEIERRRAQREAHAEGHAAHDPAPRPVTL